MIGGAASSFFTSMEYVLSLPMLLLTVFALAILLIDLMLPEEWKALNAWAAHPLRSRVRFGCSRPPYALPTRLPRRVDGYTLHEAFPRPLRRPRVQAPDETSRRSPRHKERAMISFMISLAPP